MRDYNDLAMFSRHVVLPHGQDEGDDRQALFDWLDQQLFEDLCRPVRRGRGCLVVMRGVEVRVHRARRTIKTRGRQSVDAGDWIHGSLQLDRPLSGPSWARAWWWCIRAKLPVAMQTLGDGMLPDQLAQWINQRARRSGLLPQARRQLIAAMGLEQKLLDMARCLSHEGIVLDHHYQTVWQQRRSAQRRMREAPLLWPLYDVVHMAPTCELGLLKHRLQDNGLTHGGWRLLCRHGRALWWPLRRCHEFRCNARREIVFLANLLASVGRHDLPPSALTLALGRVASVNRLEPGYACALLRPFRAAWRHMDAMPAAARAAYAVGPVQDVLSEWLLRDCAQSAPRNAPWEWFVRWAVLARQHERDQAVTVPSFGSRRLFIDFEIIPLRHLRAVREAGFALRNCMGRAQIDLKERGLAWFLVRER